MKVTGKGGISAEIIADSISSVNGKRLTTFELEYPRFIHSEFMTHRLFSRNAASSRAIPVEKIIRSVRQNPAEPVHWGKNQPGMQAKEEVENHLKDEAEHWWGVSARVSCEHAGFLNNIGIHKQVINRILEPYQFIKVVCTATEFDNFFWLRCHEDAQPEIKELADCMYKAYYQNVPQELKPGEWHVPYYQGNYGDGVWKPSGYAVGKTLESVDSKRGGYTLKEALKLSSSCCAQVSFRALDNSLEKACKIYDMLVESKPVHASPFEHQGTPIESFDFVYDNWPKGVTAFDRSDDVWSGNFNGFIQHRQLIEDNACWDYSSKSE